MREFLTTIICQFLLVLLHCTGSDNLLERTSCFSSATVSTEHIIQMQISKQKRRILPIRRSHEFPVSAITEQQRPSLSFPSVQLEVEASCLGPGEDSISFLSSLVPCTLLTAHCILFTWQQKSSTEHTYRQGQHFFLGPVSARGRGTLFSSSCEELHPPLGAQPESTPHTFWGSCSSCCREAYPMPIPRSVYCNFKHLKPLYSRKSD